MKEFGEKLRRAREEKGLTIDELHEETKIRRRYLRAMEDGNFDVLPEPVYVRGFLKTLAGTLGLDRNELLSEYQEKVVNEKPPEQEAETAVEEEPQRKGPGLGLWLIIGAAVIGLILLIVLSGGQNGAGGIPNDPVDVSAPADNEPRDDENITTSDEDKNEPPAQEEPALPEVEIVNVSDQLTRYIVDDDHVVLKVKVRRAYDGVWLEKCWISVRVDGQREFEATLYEDEEQEFTADEAVWVRVGEPRTLEITLNENYMGIPGGVTRNFEFVTRQSLAQAE